MSINIEHAITADHLNAHLKAQAPRLSVPTGERLKEVVKSLVTLPPLFPFTPVVTLSPRQPYVDGIGLMDVYKPGRWDCTSNLVFMDAIVTQGVGMWDGSVVYCSITPQTTTTHLIVAHFSGYQTTMRMNGPWGTVTAYTAETSDTGTVAAFADPVAGQHIYFTLSCTAPGNLAGTGYLESVAAYA